MKNIEFQKFIDLVTFDQNIVKAECNIKKLQKIKLSILDTIESLKSELSDLKLKKDQMHKLVDSKELSIKILETQELDLKNKINLISHQKEYISIQKELYDLEKERLSKEQDLMNLWNEFDLINQDYDIKVNHYELILKNLHQQVLEHQKEIDALNEQINVMLQKTIIQQKFIPAAWLDMYFDMKKKVENPVVPVVNHACDGCFYVITPRDMQTLQHNQLLQCRDCYRLLYIA